MDSPPAVALSWIAVASLLLRLALSSETLWRKNRLVPAGIMVVCLAFYFFSVALICGRLLDHKKSPAEPLALTLTFLILVITEIADNAAIVSHKPF